MKLLKSWREIIQISSFLGIYCFFHYCYFQISDQFLREVFYYRVIGVFCAGLIDLFAPSENISAVDNHILSPRADLEIIRGCDGAGAFFLVMAAILAFPTALKRKLVGLFWGILLLYCLNLIRIGTLYFIVAYRNDWFQLIHTYVAPSLLIILACLYFAGWALGSVVKRHEPV